MSPVRVAAYNLFDFRCLEDHEVNLGLLREDQYIEDRRKYVCQQLNDLDDQGYYKLYLDEA